MKPSKTLEKILAGSRNIRFADMIRLVEAFGFRFARRNGSHRIFVHPGIPELVNIQDVHGKRSHIRFDSSSSWWNATP